MGIDNLIIGDSDDNIIVGSKYNDLILGKGGDDIIFGGYGWDLIVGGKGDDILFGGVGLDYLSGKKGKDSLLGGAGADTLEGGKGDDLLVGDIQSSRILTGNLVINGSFEADGVVDHNGQWEVFAGGITGWQTDIGTGIEIQTGSTGGIVAADGNQKVELDSHTNSNMYQDIPVHECGQLFLLEFDYSAREHGDTAASSAVEVYWNGQLVDTITSGSSGWNTYSYELFAQGADTARLEFKAAGTDDSYGGLIDDVKVFAISTSSDDTLEGGKGNDILFGGFGADTLTGGKGIDTFAFNLLSDSNSDAWDVITDFKQGKDVIDLIGLATEGIDDFLDITVTNDGTDTTISANDFDFKIELSGVYNLTDSDFIWA
ncbi:MAG: type I secretion C-terminal target domain-containing protein [Proteobacteria bacterium]|nr:type I secretion C-terminal target domain-containing protein [Pseudomonadota bacterium]